MITSSDGGDGMGGDQNTREQDDEEDKDSASSLRALIAQGKLVSRQQFANSEGVKREMDAVMGLAEADLVERAVQEARVSGDVRSLVKALEGKVRYLVSFHFLVYIHFHSSVR